MPTHDPRAALELLPSETLYSLARNECAEHRVLAIRLLVERGSRFALRPDIVDEARALKLIDPAVAFGGKLDLDAQIAVLRAEHATDRTAVDRRLALLERSPWRKLVDWCNTLKRAWFEHSPPTH